MNKVKCIECNKELDETCFYICGNHKGKKYRRNKCKKCSNKDRLEYQRKYRKEYKNIVNERRKEYYHKIMINTDVRDNVNKGQRDRYARYVISRLFKNAQARALRKGLEFTILKEHIIVPKECPILNIPIFTGTKGNYENSPSLDRFDNAGGYTPDNI